MDATSCGKFLGCIEFTANQTCSEAQLKCDLHKCPRRCHYRSDHSKMDCDQIVEVKCKRGHAQKRKCYGNQQPKIKCRKCDMEDKRDEKILERDVELQDKRLRAQAKHDMEIADLDMQIRKLREETEDKKTAQERARALEQKKRDLEAAQRQAALQALQQASEKSSKNTTTQNVSSQITRPPPFTQSSTINENGGASGKSSSKGQEALANSKSSASKQPIVNKSVSELEWERQKKVEGASDHAIDDLMALTGLEEVKEKFLDIKAKIETIARQGLDMKKERMGMVMLGNPGTGMVCYGAEALF